MDVIAFSKANKVGKKARDLDYNVVGKEAESRFVSVDARLDWIEQQSSSFLADTVIKVDLSRKAFTDTQYKDNGVILKELSPGNYLSKGEWESDVVDLGEGWQETIKIDVGIS